VARSATAQVATEDKTAEALRLRRAGASFRAVGDALGVSHTQAQRLVEHGLARIATPDAIELRAAELALLDELQQALRPRWANGDPAAISAAVRLSESRRKLLGIDADTSLRIDVTTQSVTITRDEQFAELTARLAVAEALAEIDAETVAAAQPAIETMTAANA
jgi:hypothetical protein